MEQPAGINEDCHSTREVEPLSWPAMGDGRWYLAVSSHILGALTLKPGGICWAGGQLNQTTYKVVEIVAAYL
jgi:hypothetical protein